MKKKATMLVVLLFIPMFVAIPLFSSCTQSYLKQVSRTLNNYDIEAEFDSVKDEVSATMIVDYVNATNDILNELCFNLHANGFREDAKYKPVSKDYVEKAYPFGKSYGGIVIKSVKENNTELSHEVTGEDENELCVNFEKPLYPGERKKITISFVTTLPKVKHRMGNGGNTININNWYPVLCVYKEGQFESNPYFSNGDPFYSESANYKLQLKVPSDFVVATSGEKKEKKVDDDKKEVRVEAKCVRDIGIVLSKKFSVVSRKVNNIKIEYYYFDDDKCTTSLETASRAIELFSEKYGEYPYKNYVVAQADFIHGGMEYPNLVMISGDVKGEDYQNVIVHETAHQWWYSVVGSNQLEEAWLDEGLTEYSTATYYKKYVGISYTYEKVRERNNLNYRMFKVFVERFPDSNSLDMNRYLSEFSSDYEYVSIAYVKGFLVFSKLESILGAEKLDFILSKYFNKYRFKLANYENLVGMFEFKEAQEIIYDYVCGERV